MACNGYSRSIAEKFAFGFQRLSALTRQFLNEKGTRIMTGAFILFAWIAKPDNESDLSHI